MSLDPRMVAKLLRQAAARIEEFGYEPALTQSKPGPPYTILAAIKFELGYLPSATLMQMGGPGDPDVLMFTAVMSAFETYVGAQTFRVWCQDLRHGKQAARNLLRGLAQAIEDKNGAARWVEPLVASARAERVSGIKKKAAGTGSGDAKPKSPQG